MSDRFASYPGDDRAQPEYLTIGTITSPHGTSGEVRIYPHTDWPERFEQLTQVFLGSGGQPESGPPKRIESARVSPRLIVLKFSGVDGRSAAELLRGRDLLVPASDAWVLPEGHHYHFQLMGLTVLDTQGRACGRLSRVYSGPANDFYAVTVPGRKTEVLLPAVKHVILAVDLAAGTLTADWPELVGEQLIDAH